MSAQDLPKSDPRGIVSKLEELQPAVRVATGALLGALLVVFFSVVYSHEIFFSDRWNPYKLKYLELWFFTLSVAVLLPVMLRVIKKEFLAWYTRAGAAAAAVTLVIWAAGTWPATTTESGYTAMGYAFVENMIPFQVALHLVASTLVSSMLGHTAVGRDDKHKAFSTLSIAVLGVLATSAGMLLMLSLFQYAGLLVILGGGSVAIAGLLVLDVVPAIMHARDAKWKAPDLPERPTGPEQGVEGHGAKVRAIVYAGIFMAVPVVLILVVGEKSWETLASFLPFILPLIEMLSILIYGMVTWAGRGKLGLPPRSYGDIIRAVICLATSLLGVVAALVISGYYRDLVDTMMVLVLAIAGGFIAGLLLRTSGRSEMTEPAVSNRLNATMLAGLGLLGVTCTAGALVWLLFLDTAEIDPSMGYIDPRTVPFLGTVGVIAAGLGIGLLLCGGLGSIGEYHRKTVLARDGEPAWNVNSTAWLAMLVPAGFYMGQFFFETRVFEWGAYLETNIYSAMMTLLVAGVLIGLFVMAGGLALPRINRPRSVSIERRLPRRDVRSTIFLVAIVAGAFLGAGWITSSIPKAEPPHRVLVASNGSFTLWTAYPGEKVSDSYVPGTFQSTNPDLSVSMAAGETERLHLVLTPRSAIGNLRVNMSALRDPVSGELFPSDGLNWYYATYNFDGQEERLVPGNQYQYRGREFVTAAYIADINDWAPSPGKNQPLWLSYTSKYNTTAGNYGGNVTITWVGSGGADSLVIPVNVTVVAYQKPLAYRFSTAIGTAQGAAAARGRALWRHGRMGYNPGFPAMVLPKFWTINWTLGNFTLDYTNFYNALNACAQAGYTFQIYKAFSDEMLGTPVAPFSAQWNSTVLAILGNASLNMSNTYFDLPYGQGQIRAIDMFVDDLYDEPGKDDAWRFRFGQMLDLAANVTGVKWRLICTCGMSLEAAAWPGWSGPGGVYDVVDIRVQMPFGFQLYRDDPAVRHLADDVYPAEDWIYWINSPWPPCPNSAQAYNPGSAVFSQAIQYYTISNVSGYLFWTSGDNAWADGGDGYAGWGSGKYFYPAGDGSDSWDPCYRFEMLDDGLEVAELLRHLDAMIANGTAGPLDAATLPQAVGIRDEFEAMFPDFYTYPRPDRVGDLYALRLKLLQFLVANA